MNEPSGRESGPLADSGRSRFADFAREFGLFFLQAAGVLIICAIVLVALQFPYDTDRALPAAEAARAREFYAGAYDKQNSAAIAPAVSPEEDRYAKLALAAAQYYHVKEHVAEFVREYGLADKKVLDIGSGQGYLQDLVPDYTGLDIAPTAARYYHKRFVLGSATSMPLDPDTFDGAWSIWVLEHVPNPEAALVEIRRTVKDGGVVFLDPAWDCRSWAADGYAVRPYSDFGLWGKFVKAAIPLRSVFIALSEPLVRSVRATAWRMSGTPTTFHYHRLTPNYQTYWQADSDAVNSLDFQEMALWFQSRGDECVSCGGGWNWFSRSKGPLLIRIHKQQPAPR
jgi:SAM-dependent methyltransferase